MKLTVLGMYGPYAKPNGATSSYLVQTEDATLVFDMGSGSLSRLLSLVDIADVDAVILSHLHFDHTSDLLTCRYLMESYPHQLTVYAPRDYTPYYDVLLNAKEFNVISYDESDIVEIGGTSISFFKTLHTVPSFGARICEKGKTLSYTGDTMYYDELLDDLRGSDFVIADCSKPIGFGGPHMNVSHAVILRNELGCRILASHASADYSPVYDLEGSGVEFAAEMTEYDI